MIVLAAGLRTAGEEDRRVLVQIVTQLGTGFGSLEGVRLG